MLRIYFFNYYKTIIEIVWITAKKKKKVIALHWLLHINNLLTNNIPTENENVQDIY